MAIDFGRAAQGIATGYLQAKIRNTEANDALKAETLSRVGATLIGETIPNAIEAENVRRTNYDTLVSSYGINAANAMDASGFTVDKTSMDRLYELLEKNELDAEALKTANFATDYNNRYNTRVMSAEEKYNPILKQLGVDNIGALGYNTVEALVKPTQTTTKDTMTDTVTQAPIEFDSMQLKDYLTAKPDETTEGSQYRLRLNDIQKQAITASGLNAKFSTDATGALIVTDIDEASQNKFSLVTEISSDIFAKQPNRTDYLNIGNEAATRVKAIEGFAKAGNAAITNYFNNPEVLKNAPKQDGRIDFNSDAKVYPLKDGTLVTATEVFERYNADLIRTYVMGSFATKRFIREKFGRGYSVFFDQIDDALDKQEDS
jgi:hypothetical protein